MTTHEYRQPTHREDLERTLVGGIACFIGEDPAKAKAIADGIKTLLDGLAPAMPQPASIAALPVIDPGHDSLYEGTKRVHAKPMNRGDYNVYRGWEVPADEDPADEGYLVENVDGGKPNDSRHAGYISWSPKDIFERSYKEVKTVPGLAPHQQRVVDEHAECLERLRKLRAFIGDAKGPFRQLDDAERHRLMRQEDVMTELATVLAERVAAFQPAPVGDDFPLGKACDLSGDTACEACQ